MFGVSQLFQDDDIQIDTTPALKRSAYRRAARYQRIELDDHFTYTMTQSWEVFWDWIFGYCFIYMMMAYTAFAYYY